MKNQRRAKQKSGGLSVFPQCKQVIAEFASLKAPGPRSQFEVRIHAPFGTMMTVTDDREYAETLLLEKALEHPTWNVLLIEKEPV